MSVPDIKRAASKVLALGLAAAMTAGLLPLASSIAGAPGGVSMP